MTGVINPTKGFTYPLPTAYENETALKREDIAKFQIGFGQVSGSYTLIKDDISIEAAEQLTPISITDGLAWGQWFSAIRTVATAAAGGQTSKWGPEVDFVREAPKPKAPATFGVA